MKIIASVDNPSPYHAAAKTSTGTLPKGFSPPKPAEAPKPASKGTLPKGF